ncbi:MAG: glycoside hydrolase family 113 [Actinomycetes bacterium]
MRGRVRIALATAALCAVIPATVALAGQSAQPVPVISTTPGVDPAGVLAGGPIHGMILSNFNQSVLPSIADLSRLKADGVNTAVAYVYVHQSTPWSSDVRITPQTDTDETLTTLADHAHALGMAVEYAPVIVVDSGQTNVTSLAIAPGQAWRGELAPYDVGLWWHNYNAMITHYVNLANATHAEILSIGSELDTMQGYAANWIHLATWVNLHYHGLTTYMGTGNAIFNVTWAGYLDIISLSAYYALSSLDNPTVGAMTYVWNRYYMPKIESLYTRFHRRVLIDEVGYVSLVGAAAHPATAYRSGAHVSQPAQANAYESLLRAAQGKTWLRGIAWWHWDVPRAAAIDRTYSMRDKQGECVIAQFWGARQPVGAGSAISRIPDVCLANHITGV